jgi:hypothetical protein
MLLNTAFDSMCVYSKLDFVFRIIEKRNCCYEELDSVVFCFVEIKVQRERERECACRVTGLLFFFLDEISSQSHHHQD